MDSFLANFRDINYPNSDLSATPIALIQPGVEQLSDDQREGGVVISSVRFTEILGRKSRFDDGFADTTMVCSYPDGLSPYGACDMVGNVSEWVMEVTELSKKPEDISNGPDELSNERCINTTGRRKYSDHSFVKC